MKENLKSEKPFKFSNFVDQSFIDTPLGPSHNEVKSNYFWRNFNFGIALTLVILCNSLLGLSLLGFVVPLSVVPIVVLTGNAIAVICVLNFLVLFVAQWLHSRQAQRTSNKVRLLSSRKARLLGFDSDEEDDVNEPSNANERLQRHSTRSKSPSRLARSRSSLLPTRYASPDTNNSNHHDRPYYSVSAPVSPIGYDSLATRFTPNAALDALVFGSTPPATPPHSSPSAAASPSPARHLLDADERDERALPSIEAALRRHAQHSRRPVVDSGASSSIAARLSALVYRAAPPPSVPPRATRLEGVIGVYGADDDDTSEQQRQEQRQHKARMQASVLALGRAQATHGGGMTQHSTEDDELLALFGRRTRPPDDDSPSTRALRKLGVLRDLPVWRERMRQWLAAAVFVPLTQHIVDERSGKGPDGAAALAKQAEKKKTTGLSLGGSSSTTTGKTSLFGTYSSTSRFSLGGSKTSSLFGKGSATTASTQTAPTEGQYVLPLLRTFGSTASLFRWPAGGPSTNKPAGTSSSLFGGKSSLFSKSSTTTTASTTSKFSFGGSSSTKTGTTAGSSLFGKKAVVPETPPLQFHDRDASVYLDVLGGTSPKYVSHRIEAMGRGTCIAAFRWNGGSSWSDKPWSTELPSDAQIAIHVFCTYMDHLLPQDDAVQSKPFTSHHFAVTPLNAGKIKSHVMLYESQLHPPHFDVIYNKRLIPILPGHHNLFDALAVFLHLVHTEFGGYLGYTDLAAQDVMLMSIVN